MLVFMTTGERIGRLEARVGPVQAARAGRLRDEDPGA
jgi:hypothetical protein